MSNKKRGQIWVETVIYTLIAFIMIGLVLAFAGPRVTEIQDKTIVDQSVTIMEDIHTIVNEIKNVAGNKRLVELTIQKGSFIIDGVNDRLVFEIKSSQTYSEPGKNISHGSVMVLTEDRGEYKLVTLTGNYSAYDITFTGNDEIKTLNAASTPYKLYLTNEGGNPTKINFEIG